MTRKLGIWLQQKWQKLSRGFSDHDIYQLDLTIVKFILPRLKYFMIDYVGHIPASIYEDMNYPELSVATKTWEDILKGMVMGLEFYQAQKELDQRKVLDLMRAYDIHSIEGMEQAKQNGLNFLAKYMADLWA